MEQIITLVLFLQCTQALHNESYTYQMFSGFHFELKSDIVVYETVIPLLYQTEFINAPETAKLDLGLCKNRTGMQEFCEFKTNMDVIHKLSLEEIQNQLEVQTLQNWTQSKKVTRGLSFLQEFFQWCCDLASVKQVSGVYENQKDLQSHTNALVDSVSTQYRDLVQTSKNLNNFTRNVNNLAQRVKSTFAVVNNELKLLDESSFQSILNQIYGYLTQTGTHTLYNYYLDKHREIISKCSNNILSERLMTQQSLAHQLQKLRLKAEEKGLRLAIPTERQSLYYHLRLTTCTIHNNTLLVKVNIPLIHLGTKGEIYKAITTPVTWKDKICELRTEEIYIFKTNKYSKLTKIGSLGCDEASYPLCKLPRQTLTTNTEHLCLHFILNSERIEDLQKHCHYTCYTKPKYPLITQLLPNKYLITNINEELHLECPNTTEQRVIRPLTTGTLEMQIPCDCILKQNDLILLTDIKPCDSKDMSEIKIINLVPALWSRVRTLKMFSLSSGVKHQFENLSEILDQNWIVNVPTFEITNMKKIEHVTLSNNGFDIFGNTEIMLYALTIWLGIVTIIILGLIYIVHIQSIKVKLLLPRRDYPSVQEGEQ